MRKLALFVVCLIGAMTAYAQPTILQAEYFIGADPGEGQATSIAMASPDDSVSLAWNISTDGLVPNLYRAMVRVRDANGRWSMPTSLFLIISPESHVPQLVTQFEWSLDNGPFSVVDVTDASAVNIEQIISTVGLLKGLLHHLDVRVTDGAGRTGESTVSFLAITPENEIPGLVTQFEYTVDNQAPVVVDIEDASSQTLTQIIATEGLTVGNLHTVNFRVTDNLGRISQFTRTYLPILPDAHVADSVVAYEYWIDSNTPTMIDALDAPVISISELIGTAPLAIGLHFVNVRTLDNRGRIGREHRVAFVVTSPYLNSLPRTIVAAEVFIAPDPGIGNGVAIPFPVDGSWDESEEGLSIVMTDFPFGYNLIGIRTQDNLGRWSEPEYDSLLVGPTLVVTPSGNDIILNWQFPDGIDQYYIQRATTTGGPYTVIDSTTARTYTHTGIISTQANGFYTVTFRDDSIHVESPPGTPVRQ